MRAVKQRSRPVRDVEVERLAREALELQHRMPGPVAADQVNTALGLYARTFGQGAALAFVNRFERAQLEQAWQ